MKAGEQGDLRACVAEYLGSHHVMSIATTGSEGNTPHSANVFYVIDDQMRLIFLSQTTSLHGRDIGQEASVAATVTEQYEDWHQIRGVQLWGTARLLGGAAKTGALARYMARFPFVRDVLADPKLVTRLKDTGVYRVEVDKAGFTDNTSGLFGRQTLDLAGE